MSVPFSHDPACAALLTGAPARSPAEELQCHALCEMMKTCQSLDAALRRELARSHLTVNGFRVLAQILGGEAAVVTPGDVAAGLELPRRQVSTILGRLEVSGLTTSERMPGDRRTFTLKVTTAGRQLFAAAVAHSRAAIVRYMSVLPTRDIATLDAACVLLRQSASSAPQI
ncbi:MAG: winged helix-turn-helix transcriptional regulator [Opitutaceae bacterium]|nr:winged helix-turn-helix transcriptional regulator [Opitutaceae bacterium]MBP9913236.1 winged helix-turn-helix transcriptional regulator [Opitutaceae bacterium]